jgi:Protein of unknown function (DUF559)
MERWKRRIVEERLEAQQGVVAWWQLASDGCTEAEIEWLASRWRVVHRGVYVTGHADLTPWQRWYAASITTPNSAVARWSWAAAVGLRSATPVEPAHVVRPGTSGRRHYRRRPGRLDSLTVLYSQRLSADLVHRDGIRMTSPARGVLDMCVAMGPAQRDRLFRDAIRTRVVTRQALHDATRRHRGERGVARLKELLARYAEIPIERTRSDPEIEGLVVLQAAGEPLPAVNVDIAGYEADYVDFDRRVILELDGPQYHQFPEIDRAKQAAWEAAGFVVQRRPTDDAYDAPGTIIAGARGLNRT